MFVLNYHLDGESKSVLNLFVAFFTFNHPNPLWNAVILKIGLVGHVSLVNRQTQNHYPTTNPNMKYNYHEQQGNEVGVDQQYSCKMKYFHVKL